MNRAAQGHADHGHGHDQGHGQGLPHASLRAYLVGFLLSAVLTAVPFYLVMTGVLGSKTATTIIIMLFATVQVFVHMICFLHMTPKVEGGWSLTALGFTVTLVAIALIGSVWVMYHLNANMALTDPMQMQTP